MAKQRTAEEAPTEVGVRRALFRALGVLSPRWTGVLATNLFLRSREGKAPIADVVPLGARRRALCGANRHVYVWGDADRPKVLLVHGWGADSSSLYSLARPLLAAGFCVAAHDGPGHGTSAGSSTTMTAFVSAVNDVLSELGGVVAIVGHSLGAVATVAAASRASRSELASLVLISAPCSLEDALIAFARFWRLPPKVVAHVRRELHQRNGVPIEHWDVRSLGAAGRLPLLAVHDEDDVFVPFAELSKLSRALPHARTHRTRGLGHARILADVAVTREIADFLRPLAERARQLPPPAEAEPARRA